MPQSMLRIYKVDNFHQAKCCVQQLGGKYSRYFHAWLVPDTWLNRRTLNEMGVHFVE